MALATWDQLRSPASINFATQAKAVGSRPTGYANSPYQSLSSFAGNELLISPDWLIKELVTLQRLRGTISLSIAIDYKNLIPFKYRLLEKAWTNFIKAGSVELRVAFDQFCQEQAHWLEDYALFLWPRPGAISRIKSSKFVFLNSCWIAKRSGFRNTPELKACA
jgi:hypothetical protein